MVDMTIGFFAEKGMLERVGVSDVDTAVWFEFFKLVSGIGEQSQKCFEE